MDLGEYTTPEDFAADVKLIFKNCLTYNPPSHDVVGMAKKLEVGRLTRFSKFCHQKILYKFHQIWCGKIDKSGHTLI